MLCRYTSGQYAPYSDALAVMSDIDSKFVRANLYSMLASRFHIIVINALLFASATFLSTFRTWSTVSASYLTSRCAYWFIYLEENAGELSMLKYV